MVEIKKGEVYTACRVRSGTASRGPWELIAVKDEKQKNEVTLFPIKMPCNVKEGHKFRVKDILTIKNGVKRDDKGQWRTQVTAEVDVEPVESDLLEDVEDFGTDTPLPWDDPNDPVNKKPEAPEDPWRNLGV